jgi:hypothetical protein
VLNIYVNFMVKYVCYMGLGSNGCFVTTIALTDGHYRTNIISSVGNPKLDSVVPLVLCMVRTIYGHRCCITGPSGQYQP